MFEKLSDNFLSSIKRIRPSLSSGSGGSGNDDGGIVSSGRNIED